MSIARRSGTGLASRGWLSALGSAGIALFVLFASQAAALQAAAAQVPARAADVELSGTITRADFQTYKRVPFTVPDNVDRLVVAYDYEGRDQRTVIDLGVEDPHGLRGASGGNKSSFTIAPSNATPSYLPGRIDPGQWMLSLAVPNIREGVTSRWSARVWFLKGAEAENLPGHTAGRGPGWYRGDLHLHSAHSDGSCASQAGKTVPCPLYRTLERAARERLDFVAVTEHNTTSHSQVLREAQPWFDRLLLIPGIEITTFFGHFNVFGISTPIDFRIPAGDTTGFSRIADQVHALGGIVSVNHPALPSGEICMGCGWTMPGADYAKVDGVEVINGSSVTAAGGDAESVVSGIPFWLERLREGHAVTALGGSDNHGPDRDDLGGIGKPVTVVYAADLTQQAILAGMRSGRSFIALDPSQPNVHVDFSIRAGSSIAAMGGLVKAGRHIPMIVERDVTGPVGATMEILDGTSVLARIALSGKRQRGANPVKLRQGLHVLRIQLRAADGRLLAVGNAIRVHLR